MMIVTTKDDDCDECDDCDCCGVVWCTQKTTVTEEQLLMEQRLFHFFLLFQPLYLTDK
jgi:hypothetical protein